MESEEGEISMKAESTGRTRLVVIIGVTMAMFLLAVTPATAAIVTNGGFETGNLKGWHRDTTGGGDWTAYKGTPTLCGGNSVTAPPVGKYAAGVTISDPGRRILYQDLRLPRDARRIKLLMKVFYMSSPPLVTPVPASLDPAVISNQQFRGDVMKRGAPVDSVKTTQVLAPVFATATSGPQTLAPTRVKANLTAFRGKTVRLRIAEVDNAGCLNAGVDAIKVKVRR
jgi:hypothetical protein